MPTGEYDAVNEPGLAYKAMAKAGRWDLIQDLESTLKMIEAGEKWLPRFEKEKSHTHTARLKRNFLYAMFEKAISTLVSKPYSHPVGVDGEDSLPPRLAAMLKDVDGRGTTPSAFSRSYFQSGVKYGLGHALVDFSAIKQNQPGEDGRIQQTATRIEEDAVGARANVIEITPPNLIDWDDAVIDGKQVLTEIRFRGSRTERKRFEQIPIETVTHYQAERIDFYEKRPDEEWKPVGSAINTLGYVPLRTWYANRTGFMTALPPMLALAETNLNHWQVSSDYHALITVVAISRFFTKGFKKNEANASSVIGPSKAIHAERPEADAKWVEHTGAGVGTLENALQKIEDRGAAQASQPTSRDKSPVTATGEIRDASNAICDLQSWVGAQDEALLDIWKIAGDWVKEEVPKDLGFKVHRGFTIGREAQAEMQIIQTDAKENRITAERCVMEAQRRGIYGDDLDPKQEVMLAQDEAAERAANGIGSSDENFDDDLEEVNEAA